MTWSVPAGFAYVNVGTCRGCGGRIVWARSQDSGLARPFDRDGRSHFVSCPQAQAFRRSRAWAHTTNTERIR